MGTLDTRPVVDDQCHSQDSEDDEYLERPTQAVGHDAGHDDSPGSRDRGDDPYTREGCPSGGARAGQATVQLASELPEPGNTRAGGIGKAVFLSARSETRASVGPVHRRRRCVRRTVSYVRPHPSRRGDVRVIAGVDDASRERVGASVGHPRRTSLRFSAREILLHVRDKAITHASPYLRHDIQGRAGLFPTRRGATRSQPCPGVPPARLCVHAGEHVRAVERRRRWSGSRRYALDHSSISKRSSPWRTRTRTR